LAALAENMCGVVLGNVRRYLVGDTTGPKVSAKTHQYGVGTTKLSYAKADFCGCTGISDYGRYANARYIGA